MNGARAGEPAMLSRKLQGQDLGGGGSNARIEPKSGGAALKNSAVVAF